MADSTSRMARRLAAGAVWLGERVKQAVFRHAHRVHADGWVLPKAEVLIRGPRRSVLLVKGSVPWELGSGQRLRVRVNGQDIYEALLPPGPFEFSFPVDADRSLVPTTGVGRRKRTRQPPGDTTLLRFDADQFFVPARRGVSDDRRRIAWKIESVSWVEAEVGAELNLDEVPAR